MIIFACSDKGGTGRSVTSCNLAYQLSLRGKDVAYLDFDFGSPTSGSIFEVPSVERGSDVGGLHSYLQGRSTVLHRVDVRKATSRVPMRTQTPGSGLLILFPGDRGGAEFSLSESHIARAAGLLREMDREFDAVIVDLSAGRSLAVDIMLRALASSALRRKTTTVRWLVFHRWTRQHVVATNGLVYDSRGLLDVAQDAGHDRDHFRSLIRTVRTAVPDLNANAGVEHPAQARWLRTCNDELRNLARELGLGQGIMLGETPLEPMLLWREQVITEADVHQHLANVATFEAFGELAGRVADDRAWEGL